MHIQWPEPETISVDVQAALITEYITSYVFKKDDARAAEALLTTAQAVLQLQTDKKKSLKQVAAGILTRVMNSVNKSISFGIVYLSYLLMGYGDGLLSYKTQIINAPSFVAALHPEHAEQAFKDACGPGGMAYRRDVIDGRIILSNEVQSYLHRCSKLQDFSPVELAMAFEVHRIPREQKTIAFPLSEPHPLAGTHCHRRRRILHYPQFMVKLPSEPGDNAEDVDKEAYAAFALGLFYSNSKRWQEALKGDSLWERYQFWRDPANREQLRGSLDDLAVQMVDNIILQSAARGVQNRNVKVRGSYSGEMFEAPFMACSFFAKSLNSSHACAVHEGVQEGDEGGPDAAGGQDLGAG